MGFNNDRKDRALDRNIREVWTELGCGPINSGGMANAGSIGREERTASVQVGGAKNIVFDHATGESLDPIGLVRHVKGCTFTEALDYLVGPEDITPKSNGKPHPHREEPKHLRSDIETVINECCQTLRESESLQDLLLEKRGLTLETARRYAIGYDREKQRWSIPIRDPKGPTIGLKYHRSREDQTPKSLSEPGTQVYLFGINVLPADTNPVVITEGEWDAMVVWQSTGCAAVSGSGGAGVVKPEWTRLLVGRDLILWTDTDKAGQDCRDRWGAAISGPVRIVTTVTEGCKDATDVLLKHGPEAVKRAIDGAVPWEPKSETIADSDKTPKISRTTDLANSERFVSQHGENVRYCYAQNSWLVWDGRMWARDADGAVTALAKKTVRSIYHEVGQAETQMEFDELVKHARSSGSRRSIQDLLILAQNEVAIRQERLDYEQWLLPLENGTYDLREDRFREHRREDYFTRLAPVSFDGDADCPKFIAFLTKIMEGRDNVIAFLQRLFGISLTGDVGCQKMFIFWGSGQNGKSTLITTLLGVLGPFATKIETEILLAQKQSQHSTGLTDLYGTRLAWTSESGDGRRLAEDLVKSITGGDRIRARRMRENNFEWSPTHKLLLLTNPSP